MNTSEKEKNSTLLNSSDTDITYDTYIDDLSHYELTQTNNQMISTIRPLLKEMYKNKEIRPFWTDFITFYQIITRSSGARHMPSPSLTSNSL